MGTPYEVRENLVGRAYDYLVQRYYANIEQAKILNDNILLKNVSFPSVVDAVEFYHKIDKLSNSKIDYKLKTFSYPYEYNYEHYLKPGSILFWKYKKPDFIYGHVALVLDSNNETTTIIQQNLNPPIKIYGTQELFEKINCPKSKFLGIKRLPNKYTSNIKNVKCTIIKL
jgi:hypothetical protein